MLRIWNQKGKAVKKWRSRAWSIDPKVTNLTIIRTDAVNLERLDNANFNVNFPRLLESYPQYFDAIAHMELFG